MSGICVLLSSCKQCFRSLLLSLCLLGGFAFSSCSDHPEWHRINQGYYIYGALPDDASVIWHGPVVGLLPNGKGTLKMYDENGQLEKETKNLLLNFGVMPEYSFVPVTGDDKFAGKIKKGVPDGFGVMISVNTISVGVFKKGILYNGHVEKYILKGDKWVTQLTGTMKKGNLYGPVQQYENGILRYDGLCKKGLHNGLGQEYTDSGDLLYSGEWKNGLRNGFGKEYENGKLLYAGEWKNDHYHGDGTLYKDGSLVVYDGEWKYGKYNGRGKLYEGGMCQDGKWEDGSLVKSISSSTWNEMAHAAKHWISPSDSTDLLQTNQLSSNLPCSQSDFIEELNSELDDYLHDKFSVRVEKRFGFWNLLRMISQPWYKSDIGRANAAQKYLCKKVQSSDIQNWINAKIDYFNQGNAEKLKPIVLPELSAGSIVDASVAMKVFEREALETTDTLAGIFTDIVITVIIAFIIGIIIGLFIPDLIPYVGVVDVVMTIIAFGVGMYLSVFRTVPLCLSLESTITDMLVDNYMLFLNNQDFISQMLGLL